MSDNGDTKWSWLEESMEQLRNDFKDRPFQAELGEPTPTKLKASASLLEALVSVAQQEV